MSQIPDIDCLPTDSFLAPKGKRRKPVPRNPEEADKADRWKAAVEITQKIRENLNATSDMLLTVWGQKIYQDMNYDTFEKYCKAEFNISRPHAYRITSMELLNRRLTAYFVNKQQSIENDPITALVQDAGNVSNWRQNADVPISENVSNGSHSGAFRHRVRLNECSARELLRLHKEEDQIRAYTLACERAIARPKPKGIQADFWKPGKITSRDIKEAVRKVQDEGGSAEVKALSAEYAENARFPIQDIIGNDAISIIDIRGDATMASSESKSPVPIGETVAAEVVSHSFNRKSGEYLVTTRTYDGRFVEVWISQQTYAEMGESSKEGKPHGEG